MGVKEGGGCYGWEDGGDLVGFHVRWERGYTALEEAFLDIAFSMFGR